MNFDLKNSLLWLLVFSTLIVEAQNRNQNYLAYINQYYQLAVKQQKEHRIPASIVLAQGLLESGAGISDFAKQSNNHFGIKCNSDWTGDKIYHDDEQKGECFRKYNQVIDSYEDHAVFLSKQRYAFLFQLDPTDYEGWAHGLKKAGYATDPTYDFKLISLIEDYNLHRFDLGEYASIVNTENAKQYDSKNSIGIVNQSVKHQVFNTNAVRFVTSNSGDSYASLADELNIEVNKLYEFNELETNTKLVPGIRVYIENKKTKAAKNCETHVVQDGESMYSISQDYAIKVESLYILNKIPFTEGVAFGQVLKLR